MKKCGRCNGLGKVQKFKPYHAGDKPIFTPCPKCFGKGTK